MLALALPLLLTTASPVAAQDVLGPTPIKSGPVEVFADADEERLRWLVRPVALETWKQASALYGAQPAEAQEPEKTLQLRLYQKIANYEVECDRLVGGNFKANMAFTSHSARSAHVVLQPPLRGEAFKKLAPTFQTLALVAHETAHLARISALPNFRSHPDWFADGNATWIETQVLAAQKWMTTPEQSPTHSTYEVLAQRLLEKDRFPAVDDLLHDRTEGLEFYERYAVRWLLFRFLIEGPHAAQFRELLGDVRRFGGGIDYGDRIAEALKQRLGLTEWQPLDDELHAWLAALKPEWEEVYRSLETAGEDWAQVAFDARNAIAFRLAPAGTKPYAIEGSVTLFADRVPEPQMNLLLGRERVAGTDHERFVSVAIAPGGGATVFDFDGSRERSKQWENVAFGPMPGSLVGKPMTFRAECTIKGATTRLTVKIDGKVVAIANIGRTLEGPWGLGAQAGSSGIWRDVKQVPLGSG